MNDCFAYVFFFFFFDLRRFIRFKAEVLRQTICSLDGVVSSLSEITRRHFYIGKILIPVVRVKRVSIMYKHRLFTVPCFFCKVASAYRKIANLIATAPPKLPNRPLPPE